ncbi:hypothetical protein COT97_01410 [Candidatus Falkowbacteria bacterium CG10_big_fil_rev_8_21_14_0_10_39_11]|uniref:Uncharacterized protein n=1 Tax=Candidatus Falkowbacteria bacterium CG10_big_fil_rev_8_21_14_0_10_39_11 TaxID=1974565 RepID=A0A2H0V5S8_9BACT|nr:MAG: hypothetical protein COT97_01410 [Candidatus Falkowbacteria bacterium CG10_big_fil_rev_8_21_14_0_10_39_11]
MGIEQLPATDSGDKDIQKQYDDVKSNEGETAAFQFLLDNYNRNSGYAKKQAQKFTTNYDSTYQSLLRQASAAEMKAQLYAEYNQLPERQKTKRGSFEKFVTERMTELEAEHTMIKPHDPPESAEEWFGRKVARDLKREEIYTGDRLRTTRMNYRRDADKLKADVEELIDQKDIADQILTK